MPTRVAILPAGSVFEEYLDPLGLTLEQFRTEVTDGWLFNYVEALASAGIESVIMLVSSSTRRVVETVHEPTGCELLVLPAPTGLRMVHRARSFKQAITRRIRSAANRFPIPDSQVPVAPRHPAPLSPPDSGPGRGSPSLSLPDSLRRVLQPSAALQELISAGRVDAILCQEYEDVRFETVTRMGEKLQVPVFGIFQGGQPRDGHPPSRARTAAITQSAGLIIAPHTEADRVRTTYGLDESRIGRFPNPVPRPAPTPRGDSRAALRTELGLHPEARVAAWHGRVIRWTKGLDLLLDAWRHFDAPPRQAQLLLVGWGADAEWLRAETFGEREAGSIVWVDRFVRDRSELASYLSCADVYVFPSRHEGFPVAPLEAMALGLPVIAGNASGVDDILPNPERDGGLRVGGNDPTVLANALASLLPDRPRCLSLGLAARRRIESEFSIEAIGSQVAEWLHQRGMSRPN